MSTIKGMDREVFREDAEANGFERVLSDEVEVPHPSGAGPANHGWVDVYAKGDRMIAVSSRAEALIDHARLMRVDAGSCTELRYLEGETSDRDLGEAFDDLDGMLGPFALKRTSTLDFPVDHDRLRAARGAAPERTWPPQERIETPVDDLGITLERACRLPDHLSGGFAGADPDRLDAAETLSGALEIADAAGRDLSGPFSGRGMRAAAVLRANPVAGAREVGGIAREIGVVGHLHAKSAGNASEERRRTERVDRITSGLKAIAAADVADEVAELRPDAGAERRLDGAIRQYADDRIYDRDALASSEDATGADARMGVRNRIDQLVAAANAVDQAFGRVPGEGAQIARAKASGVREHFKRKTEVEQAKVSPEDPVDPGRAALKEMRRDLRDSLSERRADFATCAEEMKGARAQLGYDGTREGAAFAYLRARQRLQSAELVSRATALVQRSTENPIRALGAVFSDRAGVAALQYWNSSMARAQHAGSDRLEALAARSRERNEPAASAARRRDAEAEI